MASVGGPLLAGSSDGMDCPARSQLRGDPGAQAMELGLHDEVQGFAQEHAEHPHERLSAGTAAGMGGQPGLAAGGRAQVAPGPIQVYPGLRAGLPAEGVSGRQLEILPQHQGAVG